MQMDYFVIVASAVEHPYLRTLVKLCFKKRNSLVIPF